MGPWNTFGQVSGRKPDEGIDQQGHEIDIGEDTGSETEMNDME